MEYLTLIGIVIIVAGFALKLDRRTCHPAGTTLRITHAQMHYRVGNGGFSLRNIAKMKETCERFADEISLLKAGEARAQEDIFLSLYIQKKAGIKVPGWKD